MQDVLPPDNGPRSIRNIPVSRPHSSRPEHDYEAPNREGGRGGGRIWLWAMALIAIFIAAGTVASIFFGGATVTVFPRQASVTLPSSLVAGLDAPVGSLSYRLMAISQNARRSAPASGTTEVTTAAEGAATVYNDYSTSPQKLIVNTRFESPTGKIYRIHRPITVPGATKHADGTLTPGYVRATLYADTTGPEYNVGSTTLTIPGFQKNPRYKSFYAKTQGISGGFSGTQPAVSQSDLVTARTGIEQELQKALAGSVSSQLPNGFISVPGTLLVTYGAPQISDAGGGNATIAETATATEAIIRASDLANAVAKQQVEGYAGEAINFANPSTLSLSLATGTPYAANASTITLALSGTTTLLWQFDPQQIEQALAGKSKNDFNAIIKTFAPAVAKATASIRPFWQSTFPAQAAQIKIKIQNPSS